MSRYLLITGGFCGAIAIFLIMRPDHESVPAMARDVEDAW